MLEATIDTTIVCEYLNDPGALIPFSKALRSVASYVYVCASHSLVMLCKKDTKALRKPTELFSMDRQTDR